MKTLNLFRFPVILIGLFIISTYPFTSCDPDDDGNEEDTNIVVYKPNIYIYPQVKTKLEVDINFPLGGEIIASIPEYGSGWKIIIDTNGIIDDTYTYLFYESKQPNVWQQSEGWIVKREGLEVFFKENMSGFGFSDREIQDFIDYWIPRLNDYEIYAIYPQYSWIIESVIELNFSQEPDNLLRLFYFVRGISATPNIELKEPVVNKSFERKGFFAVEWGVIL